MVVPAMAAHRQGTTGSLIKRRVKASTTCLAFSPPHTTTTTSEPAAGFALRLTCHLTKYIRADLAVVQHVRFDVAGALMAGCKKIGGEGGDGVAEEEGGGVDVECSVCYDALLLRGEAVELPGCAHAFHRWCISQWFDRKSTCPLCRGDVVEHLDPELQKHIAEFTDDDAT